MPTEHFVTVQCDGISENVYLVCKCGEHISVEQGQPPSALAQIAAHHVAPPWPDDDRGEAAPKQNHWEGAQHEPHGTQVQVGWLGQTGAFYAWWEQPLGAMGDGRERGSISPVYADRGE